MNKKTTLLILTLGVLLGHGPAWAGTQDSAVIALHGKVPVLKADPCGTLPTGPCSEYTTNLPALTLVCVYIVVARADSAAGIMGLSMGIDYNPADIFMGGFSGTNGSLSWTNAGPNGDWPAAGSGLTLTWGLSNCQGTVIDPDGLHVVAGFFSNMYAYDGAVLQVTDNNNLLIDKELRVVDCALTESILSPQAKGSLGFGSAAGSNPCSCAPCVTVKLSDDEACSDSTLMVPVTVVNCGLNPADIQLNSRVGGIPQAPQQFFGVDAGDSVQTTVSVVCSGGGGVPIPVDCDAVAYTVGDSACSAVDTTAAVATCYDTPCVNLVMTGTDAAIPGAASVDFDITNCGTDSLDISIQVLVDGLEQFNHGWAAVPPSAAVLDSVDVACSVEGAHTVVCNLTGEIASVMACVFTVSETTVVSCNLPRPEITAIQDVGNDQGKQVRITYLPSARDMQGSITPILNYEVYRRIDSLPAAPEGMLAAASAGKTAQPLKGGPGKELSPAGTQITGWDYVDAFPAHGDAEYNVIVPTLADSTVSAGMHWSAFLIRAATDDPYTFWDSYPDSGYSLDNLSPPPPMSPMLNELAVLSWEESTEPDFAHYTVYGSDQDTPGPGTVELGTTTDLSMDVSSTAYPFYLVSASDFAGNESATASAFSAAATASGAGVMVQLGPSVAVTFDNVTQAGETKLIPVTADVGSPVGIEIVPVDTPIYYDLTTTAMFSGNFTLCITYDPATVQGAESDLLLYHFDETLMPPSWREITSSLDEVNHVICGVAGSMSLFAIMEPGSPTSIKPVIPSVHRLYNSFPNPFHASTTLRYDLAQTMPVRLQVVDLQGRVVKTLVDRYQGPGEFTQTWDGTSDDGRPVTPGMYFLNLETTSFRATRKVMYLR